MCLQNTITFYFSDSYISQKQPKYIHQNEQAIDNVVELQHEKLLFIWCIEPIRKNT